MPRIFDNIDRSLLPALRETLTLARRADYCVGYFNLRGWRQVDALVERWQGGDGQCCRLLVGMQKTPQDELRAALSLLPGNDEIDQATALRKRREIAEEFHRQLTVGVPTNDDEAGLRRLAAQITAKKLVVKLFLRHSLHAKLYLHFRPDPINPTIGYLGSSNLTFAGLSKQGELNIDVLDHDACDKLARWFNDRWDDRFCLDISQELVEIINASWARSEPIPPYHIYIKMAYHLAGEALAGVSEFRIPSDFGNMLFDFQKAAVQIAARHLNKRGGVVIGDVVGLGKTLMATALARIFEDDHQAETLIICPRNLVPMWEDYRLRYRLREVLSITNVLGELPDLRRFRLVLIDESHNLRNREGKRYRAIAEYIDRNDSQVVLLSATPYNKGYLDLSNQLRLFIDETTELGARPERYLRELGEIEFERRHQCKPRTLAAFEKSPYADDWRDLLRLYMVRRTRSFIQENYALVDCACGQPIKAIEPICTACGKPKPVGARRYLRFADGGKSYFPTRVPKTVKFTIDPKNPNDQYARLFSDHVVGAINRLKLPRYGLGNYQKSLPHDPPKPEEAKILGELSRAGQRLMGFCRTNLFKRLESSGHAFLLSLQRHVLRNFIVLHAIDHDLPVPIGTQDMGLLDTWASDDDSDLWDPAGDDDTSPTRERGNPNPKRERGTLDTNPKRERETLDTSPTRKRGTADDSEQPNPDTDRLETYPTVLGEPDYQRRAAEIYESYVSHFRRRFKWLRPGLFLPTLADDLRADGRAVMELLKTAGPWQPAADAKLQALAELLTESHPREKVLLFTQFADTVDYLEAQLGGRVSALAGVTGRSDDPTAIAHRFSPVSNEKRDKILPADELRVVLATDVLSEGQNLQDCSVIVNFDLPWAIIRLIQRAGRVDRIGQQSDTILCYSFLPADGVEQIIRLRGRVRQRLQENAEVVGTDEAFFDDDDRTGLPLFDLYHEKSGLLDGDDDRENDLGSQALQIWNNAIQRDPGLKATIEAMPDVVYSTREHAPVAGQPEGALVYLRTAQGNDALAWIDAAGRSVTESQQTILTAAQCLPETPALARHPEHHTMVAAGVKLILDNETPAVSPLGRPSGARFRTYERLKHYAREIRGTLFAGNQYIELERAIEQIYKFPLLQSAIDTLNRQLKSGLDDPGLAELVVALYRDTRLCRVTDDAQAAEPQVICSLGLRRSP